MAGGWAKLSQGRSPRDAAPPVAFSGNTLCKCAWEEALKTSSSPLATVLSTFDFNFIDTANCKQKFGHVFLNPGERHSHDTRNDRTVTLCTLRAATVLSRDCRADFGPPLTKKVTSHSRDGPGVSRHHCGQTLYLAPGCGIPPSSLPLPRPE